MIRSAPSISTTGRAGPTRAGGSRAARSASRAARSCSSALVRAGLREDVDAWWAYRVPPPMAPRRPARRDRGATSRRSSSCRGGSIANAPHWVPPLGSSAGCSSTARTTRSSSTARPSTSSPGATAAWSGASPPRSTATSTSSRTTHWGMFGFFECEDDPEAARRAAGRGRGLAARARARPHGRPDGLHDERRVRRARSRATTARR